MTTPALYQNKPFSSAIKRRKPTILAITIGGLCMSYGILSFTPPTYIAHAQLLFENKDNAYIATQNARLHNESLMQKVIATLPVHSQKNQSSKGFKAFNLFTDDQSDNAQNALSQKLAPEVFAVLNNLKTHHHNNAATLDLSLRHHNPHLSAYILNHLIEAYIKEYSTSNEAQPHEKTLLLLQQNLDETQKTLYAFEQEIQGDAAALPADHHANKKRTEIADKLLFFKNAQGDIVYNDNAPIITQSPAILSLQSTLSALTDKQNILAKRYGHKHPKMKAVKADIAQKQRQIRKEGEAILLRLQAEYKAVKDTPKNQETQATAPNQKSLQALHSLLQKRAENAKMIYDRFKGNYSENAHAPAVILQSAYPPMHPAYPNPWITMILGGILSFILGLLAAFYTEKYKSGFISGKQLEHTFNLPCYALTPLVHYKNSESLADHILNAPTDHAAESVRALRLTLKLRAKKPDQCNVITLSSSLPNEGKTTLSIWLARLAAIAGERVILIDADLRRASVHHALNHNNALSLVEYLGGQCTLNDVIDTGDASGLHIIYGRSAPNSALDLLSGDKMADLIASLRKAYDLVIIDSPACLAVADAKALAHLSDLLLYAVAWNKTTSEIVHNGISQFSQITNAQIATVLTQIDLKKHVQYGYGQIIEYDEQ